MQWSYLPQEKISRIFQYLMLTYSQIDIKKVSKFARMFLNIITTRM